MVCNQCKKNRVTKMVKIELCNSCYVTNYRRSHPEKCNYKYGGKKGDVFKRDNYRCVICGNDKKLEIHHIDGYGEQRNGKRLKVDEQNNKLSNMVTLCRGCHARVDSHKKTISGWSRKYDKCVKCKTDNYEHRALGLCISCYDKKYQEENRIKRRKYRQRWFQERGKYLAKVRKKAKNI